MLWFMGLQRVRCDWATEQQHQHRKSGSGPSVTWLWSKCVSILWWCPGEPCWVLTGSSYGVFSPVPKWLDKDNQLRGSWQHSNPEALKHSMTLFWTPVMYFYIGLETMLRTLLWALCFQHGAFCTRVETFNVPSLHFNMSRRVWIQ